ncbi:MAG TPA: CDP-diacylglycerol--serine O-phosphatidyltransferase [Candidatus Acidoferrales bacterium]|nr:CDP-diacylglycerol--serine O-phosphatidyltransferase [Candidatus Acidoferrales bacterium]
MSALPEAEQHELLFPGGQRLRNHRRRRGIFLIPSMLTVGNLLCGYYAVLAVILGDVSRLDHAARAIGIAFLFDSMDGFTARLMGSNSDFGKNLDSLADMVSFGIAPAALAYAWGIREIPRDSSGAVHLWQFAWVMCLFFSICCAWRLARFNVQGMAAGTGMKYFIGMPTPAAAGVVAATVHFFQDPVVNWHWSVIFFAVVGALALLMTSTIRYPSFKNINWGRRQPSLAVVVIALLAWIIFVYSEQALIVLAGIYALSGITLHIVRFLRLRQPAHPA